MAQDQPSSSIVHQRKPALKAVAQKLSTTFNTTKQRHSQSQLK
jgi:hypothetical protein